MEGRQSSSSRRELGGRNRSCAHRGVLLAPVSLSAFFYLSGSPIRDGAIYSTPNTPTTNRENVTQMYSQANLMEAFLEPRFPPPD